MNFCLVCRLALGGGEPVDGYRECGVPEIGLVTNVADYVCQDGVQKLDTVFVERSRLPVRRC